MLNRSIWLQIRSETNRFWKVRQQLALTHTDRNRSLIHVCSIWDENRAVPLASTFQQYSPWKRKQRIPLLFVLLLLLLLFQRRYPLIIWFSKSFKAHKEVERYQYIIIYLRIDQNKCAQNMHLIYFRYLYACELLTLIQFKAFDHFPMTWGREDGKWKKPEK